MNFLKGNIDMRNPRRAEFFFMLAMSILLFNGCSKEPVDPPNTMRDIDGNIYKTVTISSQTWMAENLRVTHYSNGRTIPSISDNREWSGDYDGMCCDYNFIPDEKRGKLYNWYAVEDYQGRSLAPEGWHIPTAAEWKTLIDAMGESYTAGYRLKDSISWPPPEWQLFISKSGFNAIAAGVRNYYGTFERAGEETVFWTSTTDEYVYYKKAVFITKYGENVNFLGSSKTYGFSVRCVRDR